MKKNSIDSARLRAAGQAIVGTAHEDGLAHKTVAAIEADLFALGWPTGQALGTMPDVQHRFGLGRFACREAVTIMQARGLLDVRRGRGGGLFVTEPPLVDVARAFTLFLVLSGAQRRHLHDVRCILWQAVLDALRQAAPVASLGPIDGDPLVLLAKATGREGLHFVAGLVDHVLGFCREPGAASALGSGPWAERMIAAINERDDRAIAAMSAEMMTDAYLASDERIRFVVTEGASGPRDISKPAGVLAARLLDEILAQAPGDLSWQCSERSIMSRYGYSRPMVRAALRLLEDIGGIEILRGRTGGVRASVPDNSAMIRLLVPCLAKVELSSEDIIEISVALADGAPRIAAEARRQMPDGAFEHLSPNETASELDMFAMENRLLDLAGNPVLTTLVRAFAAQSLYCAPLTGKINPSQAGYDLNLAILQAVKAGRVDEVTRLAKQKKRLFYQAVGAKRQRAHN